MHNLDVAIVTQPGDSVLFTELASVCCFDADEMRASLELASSLLACFLAHWRL